MTEANAVTTDKGQDVNVDTNTVDGAGDVNPDETDPDAIPDPDAVPAGTDGDAAPPGTDTTDGDDPPESPDKQAGGVQKKINKLTRRAKTVELENARLRGVVEGMAATTPAAEAQPDKGIIRDDFDTEEEYIDAKIADGIDKGLAKVTSKGDSPSDVVANIQKQYAGARDTHEDFDEIALAHDHPVTAAMFEAAQGEHLTDILYHLGKNHGESERIAALSPAQAAKEIGKIEMTLTKPNSPNPKPKKPSGAPDPPPKVKPGDGRAPEPVSKDQKSNFAKWDKKREDRLKRGG